MLYASSAASESEVLCTGATVKVSSSTKKTFTRMVNKSERQILLTPQLVVAKLCLHKNKQKQQMPAEMKKKNSSGGMSTQQSVLCSSESDKLSFWSPVMGHFELNLGNLEKLISTKKQGLNENSVAEKRQQKITESREEKVEKKSEEEHQKNIEQKAGGEDQSSKVAKERMI